MSLKSSVSSSVESIDHIAVCIQKISDEQRHLGIFYKDDETDKVRFLHLAWHYMLQDEEAPLQARWVESNLNSTLRKQLWAYISMLASSPTRIPYGFENYSQSIDPNTGIYLKTGAGEGLTCASFVLAVFDAHGLQMINQLNWPNREDDENWQKDIIKILEGRLSHPNPNLRVSQEHIEGMKQSMGFVRIRPEEVAGAFGLSSQDWALDSDQVIPVGEDIVKQLNAP